MSDRAQAARSDRKGLTAGSPGLAQSDYPAGAAVVSAPGVCGLAADPAGIAGSVVEAVTRAVSLLRPAEAGRASHG
jgi:hypothetical protein